MRIKVKKWWYEKEQTKAQSYNWTLCWENLFKMVNENGELVGDFLSETAGKMLYDAGNAEKVGYVLFGEPVKETEKAIQYTLKFWNLNKAGHYVTDAPVESKWKTWIPKSVLLLCE